MHLAGVGASPSSDSLALSHLGDDSWWHLPLVPRPPGSEAITVVNQTEFTILSVKTATPKKQKKKRNRACLQVYLYIYILYNIPFWSIHLPYISFHWLQIHHDAGCTKSFSCQRPCSHWALETIASNRPGPQGFWGSWFFWGEIVIGKLPPKKNKQIVKNFWRLVFFLKNSPISMYITC